MLPTAPVSEALGRALVVAPLSVAPETTVATAAALMAAAAAETRPHAAERGSCVLALAPGTPPALLAAGDLVALVAQGVPLEATPVGAVARPAPRARRAELADPSVAVALLGGGGHLVVEDDTGRLLGLITPASLLAAQRKPAPLLPDERALLMAERDQSQAYARSLRDILQVAGDLVATVRGDGQFIFLNAAARAMLGFGPDEDVTQLNITAHHPPAIIARLQREVVPQVVATGQWAGETVFLRRDGTAIPVWQTIVAHYGPDGQVGQFSTIARDISERLQSEQALRESEERLRLALFAANQGLYDLNIQTGEAVISPEYASMLGYDPATFQETNQRWLERLHPDDAERVAGVYQAYLAGELTQYAVEHRQRTRDGCWQWILSLGKIVAWDEAGQPLRMLGTHTDITARKEAEEALRELNQQLEQRVAERTAALQASQERLRKSEIHLLAAQRIAALGSWELDIATGEVIWSEEVFRIYGRDPALGAPGWEELQGYLTPESSERLRDVFERAIAEGRPYELELHVRRSDGELRVTQARAVPILDAGGKLVRLVGTAFDITERRHVEEQLREAVAQLGAANKELEAFAYSVSHDLRAPLRAIDGFSQALVEDYGPQLDAEARAYLARIRGGVARMSQLIDDLLQLSRVSRAEMRRSPVDLSALVRRAVAELREAEPGREVELVLVPRAMVWGDMSLLRVALNNLLANAWKFTGRRERARVEFGVTRAEAGVTYFVRDNGAGYDPAYAHKLFGVFQRLHDTSEFPGTGIGLATVQRVIHRHGGQVWAEGAVGQGATFFFTLPGGRLREER